VHRFISDRQRGQTSYLVTVMMALMMSFTLGQVRHLQTINARGRALSHETEKARLLSNAVQEVRITGLWTGHTLEINGASCAYRWRWDLQDNILVDAIETSFPDRPGWARPASLFVETEALRLTINCYRDKRR